MTYPNPAYRFLLLVAMLCMAAAEGMYAQGQGEAVPVTIQTLKLQTTDRKEISITPPATTAGYSLTLPLTAGANGSVLTSNGEGVLSWVLPSTTGWSLLGNGTIDSTLNFLGTTNGQPLVLKTNGAEAFRIRSTGQVLVTSLNGTATASVPNGFDRIVLASSDGELSEATILSVVGAGIEGNAWSLSGNTTTTAWNGTSGTYLGTKSAQPLVLATTNATAQDIRFYTGANGATERLRIKSTGELVVSDLGGVTPSGPPIPGGYDRVVIANSSGELNEVSIPALFTSTGWALAGNDSLTSGGALGETATGTAKLGTNDGVDLRLITNGLTRMIISSAGAITMGSTLGVTGATTIGGTLTLSSVAQGVAADSVLLINSSNQVTRTSRASLFANSGWALAGNNITDASTQFLGTTSSQPLVIRTNNTEKLRITSDGELLIGVATDGGTYVVQTSGNALVGGHVDINTSGQSRRISTRYLSGTSGNNIFIGGGGANLSTTGDINDASNNVSLGVNALNANTAGRQNIAIGSSALQANTTGMGNIAVGSSALLANTTGYYNTATGLLSLTANTSGLFNTAYGYGTLQANTTASDNVAVGFTAMGSNTTGGSNVAVGGHALSGNTTGTSNTAIGGNAGRFLNPGGSLVPNTNSSRSVFVGNDTRASDSTNVNEIVIGARARGSGSNTATIGDSTLVATHLRGHLNLTYPAVAATAPELRLYEATTNGSNYTALRAGAQSANITYTLPTAAPTVAGQVLSAATDGTMSWSTPSSTSWSLSGNSITDASTQFLGTTSSQPLVIRTNNTEKLRITSDGSIGIGITNPSRLLDVAGTMQVRTNEASVQQSLLRVLSTSSASESNAVWRGRAVFGAENLTALFGVYRNQATIGAHAWTSANAETGAAWADLYLNWDPSAGGGGGNVYTKGSFGIGTTSPGAQLQVTSPAAGTKGIIVRGAASATANLFEAQNSSGTVLVRISSSGLFEATQGMTLTGATTINTTGTAATTIGNTTAATAVTINTGTDGRLVLGGLPTQTSTSDDVLLINASNQVSRMTQANLLAGTGWALTGNDITSSSGALGVAPTGSFLGTKSTSTAKDLRIATNGLTRMIVSSAGQLSTQQDVVVNTVTVGLGAGNVSTNVAVGTDALKSNTTGRFTTGTGHKALESNTTGDYNSAFGMNALQKNTTGNYNTAVGTSALRDNVSGIRNTAIGNDALLLSTGSDNVALGWQAGYNETGSNKLYIANSASNNLIYGDFSTGRLSINGGSTPSAPGASLQINAFSASTKGLIVRGASGGTENLFEAQNNAGTALVSISSGGLITGSAGATITGATTINTTGTAATTIGNTTAATAVTINTGTDGRLVLGGLPTQTSTSDDVLLINGSNQVSRITKSNLINTSGWTLTGNTGTTNGGTLGSAPTGSFVGTTGTTTNARDLSFVTNNVIQMQISTAGVVSTQNDVTVNTITVGRGSGSGFYNTTVGRNALAANTSGEYNTAIGYEALKSSTTSNANTALGVLALQDIAEGSGNTAIGMEALADLSNAAAWNNVALGYRAGFGLGASGVQNAANSIFLGVATAPAGEGQTNQIVIGYGVTGNGSNTATIGDSLTGTYLRGHLHLNYRANTSIAPELRLYEPGTSGSNYTALRAQAQAADVTYTLPAADGSNGQVLTTNGTGTLSWSTALTATTGWSTSGNAGTDSTAAYIGTTDETVGRPLVIKTDGTERARFAGGSGYLGVGTNAPTTSVDINGGLRTRPGAGVTANSANTAITVGNQSFIAITSDDVFSSRRVTLSDGQDGQRLVLVVLGSGGNNTYGVRLETSDANLRLSGDAGLEDGDTIELIYYGTNWFELKRSVNDD